MPSEPVPDRWVLRLGTPLREAYRSQEPDDTYTDFTGATATLRFRNKAKTSTYLTVTQTANGNGSIVALDNEGNIAPYVHQTDIATIIGACTDTDQQGNKTCVADLIITESGGDPEAYLVCECEVRT